MYAFKITQEALQKISELSKTKYREGVENNLELLNENPLSRAKKTNNNVFAEYYINCGNQHCILFDVDEKTGTVKIYRVLRRAHLHKILVGWS